MNPSPLFDPVRRLAPWCLGALMLAGCAAVPPGGGGAASAPCDRACLVDITARYVKALGERQPQAAGLAPRVRMTENGAEVTPDRSLFASATRVHWHQVFADGVSGQTSAFARLDDAQGPVLYAVRLKMEGRLITEVEAMVNRKGAHPFFDPDALPAPRAVFDAPLPAAQRVGRVQLQAAAQAYLDAIEQHSSEVARFHPECMRIENGVRTTDNPARNLPRSCRSGMQMFTYIPVVRDRVYPVIDEERGVVFAWAIFDMPGKATHAVVDGQTLELPARVREPKSMRLAEVFKVVDGQLHTIEAFIRYEPLGVGTGWAR